MNRLKNDFGPVYAETELGRFPVEPWNTASTVIFLLIVFYFWRKTSQNRAQHRFTLATLPVLFVGFVGGLVYHATRSHWIWLVMDFVPIFILTALAMFYFWNSIFRNWWRSLIVVLLVLAITGSLRSALESSGTSTISIGYALLAVNILLPAGVHAWRNSGKNAHLLIGASFAFGVAVLFRSIDSVVSKAVFPMGTHFLWHVLGGLSVFALMEYVFQAEKGTIR